MYIVPINTGMPSVGGLSPMFSEKPVTAAEGENPELATPFEDLLKTAISNVKNTAAVAKQDTIDLAMGNVDNLANIIINMEKADTAMQLLTTVRNKALDAYTEIMRMNI